MASPQTKTASTINGARPEEPRPLRWTKQQYHQMADAGLFQDKRVELVEGEIIEMAPMNAPHWTGVLLLRAALQKVFSAGFVIADQLPISLVDESEPEPDAAVIAGDIRDFKDALPTTAVLVVEVSDTTLAYDRGRKMRLYAKAGIAEYWIVNLKARQLEVHREPKKERAGWRYSSVQILDATASLAPLAAPDSPIAVADLLP